MKQGVSFLVIAVLAAACSPEAAPPSSIVTVTTTTAATSSTPEPPSSTTAPPGDEVIVLPEAPIIDGEAPVRVAGLDLGVAEESTVVLEDWEQGPFAPEGSRFGLLGCSTPYPGVVIFELDWSAPPAAVLPVEATLTVGLYSGDEGLGGAPVRTSLSGSGVFRLVLPLGRLPIFGDADELSTSVSRTSWDRRVRPGWHCDAEVLTVENVHGDDIGWDELTDGPRALEATAPEGSFEALAQGILATEDAPLLPLAVLYGDGVRLFADRLFLPPDPPRLDEITEELSDGNRCLTVNLAFDDYSLLQQRGCAPSGRTGVWEAGGRAFTVASDGTWEVLVGGPDATAVVAFARSLQPYVFLDPKPIPLVPGGEQEVGYAEFEGEEILITLAGQKGCTASCRSPESFFYLYRVDGTTLIPYAYYPAYGACLLAEEEPWTLAIIESPGRVRVRHADVIRWFEADLDGYPSFAFALLPAGTFSEVRLVERGGGEPGCVGLLAADDRGGIGPWPGAETTTTTQPEGTSRTSVVEACNSSPVGGAGQWSEEPFLATGCVNTPMGRFGMARVVPNGMLMDPPTPGWECLIDWHGTGGGANCYPADADRSDLSGSGDGEYAWITILVPEGTTRVVGSTRRGDEIICLPYERMALVWWPGDYDELATLQAETPQGNVDLTENG